MRMFVQLAAAAAVAAGLTMGSGSSHAVLFSFNEINDPPSGADDLYGQLLVDVQDLNGQVSFYFTNEGSINSVITGIYFDNGGGDGTLLSFANLDADGFVEDSHENVSFSSPATPENLTEADNADPDFVTDFSLSSLIPGPPSTIEDGIENGLVNFEWLKVIFNRSGDTIAALMAGDLRIGLRIQGFDGGESATYLNNPTPIPLPAGLVLFLSGLAGIGFLGRYKARRQEAAVT